jgi:hypothetical protein
VLSDPSEIVTRKVYAPAALNVAALLFAALVPFAEKLGVPAPTAYPHRENALTFLFPTRPLSVPLGIDGLAPARGDDASYGESTFPAKTYVVCGFPGG